MVCMYYNYNNISHNLYFSYKNKKTPMGKSQQRAEFSGLWQSSWSANSNYLHFWLSILKSVEEIHLRLYQSHKDPKFPGAWGQSLCSRQIQIVVYLTIPCKLLSANTLQYFMAFKTLLDVVPGPCSSFFISTFVVRYVLYLVVRYVWIILCLKSLGKSCHMLRSI